MNDNEKAIFELLKNEADRVELISTLELLNEDLFKVNTLLEIKNPRFNKAIEAIFPKNWEEIEDKTQIQKIILDLIEKVKSIRTVTITLAFHPSQEFTRRIASILSNPDEQVILQISVKPEIIGGIILTLDGKYIDLSLEKKLEDAFVNHRDEISALFK